MRSTTFFNFPQANQGLSNDMFRYLMQWLNLQGPMVKLIDGEPSDQEKSAVIAVALHQGGERHRQRDEQRPDLSTYHLIRAYSVDLQKLVYSIGFCQPLVEDGPLVYTLKELDEESRLLRYVSEDLQHLEYSKLFPHENPN